MHVECSAFPIGTGMWMVVEGDVLALLDGPSKDRTQGLVAELDCAQLPDGISLTLIDPPWGKKQGTWDTEPWRLDEFDKAVKVRHFVVIIRSCPAGTGIQ